MYEISTFSGGQYVSSGGRGEIDAFASLCRSPTRHVTHSQKQMPNFGIKPCKLGKFEGWAFSVNGVMKRKHSMDFFQTIGVTNLYFERGYPNKVELLKLHESNPSSTGMHQSKSNAHLGSIEAELKCSCVHSQLPHINVL